MKFAITLFFLTLLPSALAEQTSAQYLDLPPDAQPQKLVAADASGNLFVVLNITAPSGRSQTRLLKVDPDGRTLASKDLDVFTISSAVVTPKGNLVIAAANFSADFPMVSPVLPNAGPSSGLLVEVDSQLQSIVFSTRIGGTTGQGPAHGGTSIGALGVDAAGNLYVTGSTADTDFPLTSGAFQTQPPAGQPVFGTASFAFLTEISADRKRLVVSTYFGDSAVVCIGGSHCIGVYGRTGGSAVALDSTGNIVIAGTTTANKLPVTTGVYGPDCKCTSDLPAGFVASFDSSGNKLRWATFLPLSGEVPYVNALSVSRIALDSNANVVLGGIAGPGLITTPGAVQTSLAAASSVAGYITKLDSLGQHVLFSTYFGESSVYPLFGAFDMALARDGAIWFTGTSDPNRLPHASAPLLGTTYVASIASDGSSVTTAITAPAGAAGQAIVIRGDDSAVTTLGASNSLLVTTPRTGPSLMGVANSAAAQVSNAVAPYELISLYGIGIGPSPRQAQVVNGVVTTNIDGVQVEFNGTPGPILYAGPNQINVIVPGRLAADTVRLQITTQFGVLAGPTLLKRPSAPAVFANPGTPYASAVNQDGTINSQANPAAPGSIVAVWATGAGETCCITGDGTIGTGPTDQFRLVDLPVSVLTKNPQDGVTSLELLYAGPAPGIVNGVIQVNFRLPQQFPSSGASFQLQVGDATGAPFLVYVQGLSPDQTQ